MPEPDESTRSPTGSVRIVPSLLYFFLSVFFFSWIPVACCPSLRGRSLSCKAATPSSVTGVPNDVHFPVAKPYPRRQP